MFLEILKNPVLLSVLILLVLSMIKMHVAFALIIAAMSGGLLAKLGPTETVKAFSDGLSGGVGIAFNYAILGAFSIAISKSGITELLAKQLFKITGTGEVTPKKLFLLKYFLIVVLTLVSISSQNLIPIHIAFIPIFIPPLLKVFEKVNLDRRMVACILTFGLITPYMVLPFGFGRIYLNDILIKNINSCGVAVTADMAPKAMLIPALGMVAGLLIAVFFSYRKPRVYDTAKTAMIEETKSDEKISPWKICIGFVAIAVALAAQFWLDSLAVAALGGILVFMIAKVISMKDSHDVFAKGIHMMGGIGIIMIAASGFAKVMKATGHVDSLVELISLGVGDRIGLAVFLMLLIGLIITMGIGSSFSTVPLIAAIYVPLCVKLGLSPLATIAIIGVAGALGDAGSPASESVLGPTAGLNADGQHDHIYDSTIPTFIHYNIPLLIAGWIAGMIL